jgi:hypothetical protein
VLPGLNDDPDNVLATDLGPQGRVVLQPALEIRAAPPFGRVRAAANTLATFSQRAFRSSPSKAILRLHTREPWLKVARG